MISEAVKNDQLKALIAIRDRLAFDLDAATSARDVGILSKQLVEVLSQIAAIKPAEKSKVDELAEKRAERRRNAAIRRPDAEDSEQSTSAD
jgi:hypothetical protein